MITSCRNELEKANQVNENVSSNVEVDPNTVSNNQPIEVSVCLNLNAYWFFVCFIVGNWTISTGLRTITKNCNIYFSSILGRPVWK